jgi:uracil-DNA glycosylase
VLQIDPSAKILIAGQAPGRIVHETGIPFDDPSGDRLRKWLGVDSASFYNKSHFAIVPMGFCFPGAGKQGDLPPRKECAPLWRQQVLDAMPNIKLTVVIGQYAQAWHLNEDKKATVTERVSNWQHYAPDTLVIPHPSPRNRRWLSRHPWFEEQVVPYLQNRVQQILSPAED